MGRIWGIQWNYLQPYNGTIETVHSHAARPEAFVALRAATFSHGREHDPCYMLVDTGDWSNPLYDWG